MLFVPSDGYGTQVLEGEMSWKFVDQRFSSFFA